MRLRRAVGALSERNFRLLFASSTISGLGDGISVIALVFAVLQVSDSAIALGLVLAARQIADAAIVLAAGVWADRLPRHLVLIAVAVVQGIVQAITGALVLSGSATIGMLVVLQAIYGLAEGFYLPASTGLIPATISPGRLQQANALLGLVAERDENRRPGDRRRHRRGGQPGVGASDRCRVLWARRAAPGAAEAAGARRGQWRRSPSSPTCARAGTSSAARPGSGRRSSSSGSATSRSRPTGCSARSSPSATSAARRRGRP